MSFLNNLIKISGNEDAGIVSDGLDGSDISGFIDTGCYALNGLLSGSLYGGLPNNKIICFAGEAATGKTYFTMGDKKNALVYFEKAYLINPEDKNLVLTMANIYKEFGENEEADFYFSRAHQIKP